MEDFRVLAHKFMKASRDNSISRLGLICLVLFIALFCIFGCAAPKPTANPLVGWRVLYRYDNEILGQITADSHAYINNLPQELRIGVGPIHYFEDDTGQHAVRFETGAKGVSWSYVLIYDINNNRIKVIKYVSGYYRS